MRVPSFIQSTVSNPNFILNLCMLWICFGYYYKILCNPIQSICRAKIYYVDVNHWVELFVYCPVLYWSLYSANRIVFRESKASPGDSKFHRFSHNFRKQIGAFAVAMNLYGMGIHAAANPIEILSRTVLHVEPDNTAYDAYKITRFMDENLSHWIQFIPFFFAIGWYIINDRTERYAGAYMSVFMGVGHGVDRAIGVIEGNSWFFGIPMSGWLLFCCWIRWRKYGKDFRKCIDDYFFRHGLAIGITIPSCQLIYFMLFNGFSQPSDHEFGSWPYYYQVIYTFGGTFVFFIVDQIRIKKWGTLKNAHQHQHHDHLRSSDSEFSVLSEEADEDDKL